MSLHKCQQNTYTRILFCFFDRTDKLIQATIRAQFSGCTVMTVAHRLNTIVDSDRVLVLDAGCITEFDSPEKLFKEEGTFFKLIVEAGLESDFKLKN